MNPQSLAPHTGKLIEAVSRLECIKPFVLVGGTALSIQLKTRQSEDLDFMRWQQGKDDKLDIRWPSIQRELETSGADIHKLIPMALEHSGHKLKTKGLMAMLTNGELFRKDEQFAQLQPIYDVSARDIEEYIKGIL